MRLAIIGSRTFDDLVCAKKVYEKLLGGFRVDQIISGGAKGADLISKQIAEFYNVDYLEFPAEWDKHGKSAGFRRNQQIIDACQVVLAFHDGKSKGTEHSINLAREAKKHTLIWYFQ